ncbi:hypothetical protein FSARC_10887 [Fusarium sarcochroum]|uniref:Major facilitator superfamily (MFS) profile domain-containing protein n=1 Tax=Fusarium sarcochroum TaxID=1208366 RepID=A0A8H4X2S3_9HYPO|nr:hypothetical protein FSARC_10887 [Fusarium sarcochroum]
MLSLRRSRHNPNALANVNQAELRAAVQDFHQRTSQSLTGLRAYPTEQEVQDAAAIWHQQDNVVQAVRNDDPNIDVPLNAMEKSALIKELDHTFSERGMWMVILTWIRDSGKHPVNSRFAFANAAVYFSAAVLGCPLAAPVNSLFGRRGAIILASVLILAASVGSAAIPLEGNSWALLGGIRLIGGVGMGLKATSTPILAAETAIGSWRGSSVLLWQLWVAFGIMTSFIVNICLNQIRRKDLALRLILASPAMFALVLIYTGFKCPESFRYYLMPGTKNYSPEKAYASLLRLRNTKYWKIFKTRRLRNAAMTTGIVALSQQLSGINLMAFYGGTTLVGISPGDTPVGNSISKAMVYNLIFGLVNFLFCLPTIHYIDVLGRRKILLFTIPGMAIGLMAAAVSFGKVRNEIVAFWIYFHTAFYSPGMGPVPFILAAESFPLAYRDTGASLAISINFLFAGLLAWLQPLLVDGINFGGTLGVFSGLNIAAFVLIFLLVEETGRVPLEALGVVFNQSKGDFVHFQAFNFLPWLCKFLLRKSSLTDRPERVFDYEERSVTTVYGQDDDANRASDSGDSDGIRMVNRREGNGEMRPE